MDEMKLLDRQKIQIFRIKNDLTLEQMGRATGISKATLNRIENGRGKPNIRTMYKIYKTYPEAFSELEPTDGEFARLLPEPRSAGWNASTKA